MQQRIGLVAAALVMLGATSAAHADHTTVPMQGAKGVAGEYTTTFEQVSSNCKNTGISLKKTSVRIDRVSGRSISMTIPMVPNLRGAVRKGGKFRAKAKKGRTGIQGVDGRFSAGGRIDGNSIQFVFVAEYFRGSEPMCTQSWNATGTKKK